MQWNADRLSFLAALALAAHAFAGAMLGQGTLLLPGMAISIAWLAFLYHQWNKRHHLKAFLFSAVIGPLILAPLAYGAWFMFAILLVVIAGFFQISDPFTIAILMIPVLTGFAGVALLLVMILASLADRLSFFRGIPPVRSATVVLVALAVMAYLYSLLRFLLPLFLA
jgi:hypothetical protein